MRSLRELGEAVFVFGSVVIVLVVVGVGMILAPRPRGRSCASSSRRSGRLTTFTNVPLPKPDPVKRHLVLVKR